MVSERIQEYEDGMLIAHRCGEAPEDRAPTASSHPLANSRGGGETVNEGKRVGTEKQKLCLSCIKSRKSRREKDDWLPRTAQAAEDWGAFRLSTRREWTT